MSDIVRSKPQILYEHVLELRNLCYRVKQVEKQDIITDENFMSLSSSILKSLLKSLHIDLEEKANNSVLENIYAYTSSFEKHILGTDTIKEEEKKTLEQLIINITSIQERMQQHDNYCTIL